VKKPHKSKKAPARQRDELDDEELDQVAGGSSAPTSIDVVVGEGVTMNCGLSDGTPPPEITLTGQDGTTTSPGN
jgi:hypothetical protein